MLIFKIYFKSLKLIEFIQIMHVLTIYALVHDQEKLVFEYIL